MKTLGLIDAQTVKNIIGDRPEDIHKGQCGRVLIIAGHRGMAGAAVLSAKAALKSGAGLVTIATPADIFDILQISVPQATCIDIKDILYNMSKAELNSYDCIAIGPGLGVDEDKYSVIEKILIQYDGTAVVDADGINCICRYSDGLDILRRRPEPVVLTPHPGEGERLLAALDEESIKISGRKKAAEVISEATGAVVLMKGAGTVVTQAEAGTYINTTGNPGMATGGSGDVLTGVIASIAASGSSAFDSAVAGAYIHGKAGDIAAKTHGIWGMTSMEIADSLPQAFKNLMGK